MKDDLKTVGKILGAHGLKGEIKLHSFCEDPKALFTLLPAYVGSLTLGSWSHIRPTGKKEIFIARSQDLTGTREDLQRLRSMDIQVSRANFPIISQEQIYYVDLLHKQAWSRVTGCPLGQVKQVHNFGAGDILEIAWSDGTDFSFISFDHVDQVEGDRIWLNLGTLQDLSS